ncbi:MAG: FHA domain-containing protein, partial [Thermoanaerobaculales bacterium]|nr:FHA domain-containing protein [Thermoanaerobaculales bacterium]
MTTGCTSKPKPVFQLVGEVEDQVFSYVLREGEHSLGAAADNDVVLDVRGVSKNHARLSVGSEEIVLEDLKSKNGTFVNGRRVERSTIICGDSLRFGSAEVIIREVDPDDVEVAIEMERRKTPRRTDDVDHPDTTTEDRPETDEPPSWVALLGRFAAAIGGGAPQPLSVALAAVTEELECSGICIFSWDGEDDPIVRGSFGDVPQFIDDPEVRCFLVDALAVGNRESVVISHIRNEAPHLAWSVNADPGA